MVQLLPVPFHKQKANGYCLPACVQMVLAYQNYTRSQDDLAQLLAIHPGLGAPTRSVLHLASDNLLVRYDEGSLPQIEDWLKASLPVIVFVQSGELAYWQGEAFQHAVVVVGLDDTAVWLLDPGKDNQPIAVPVDEFMLAWLEMDYLCATLNLT
jgi:ABC-type bacteriocin/lantibiotic exporter with double-glycine peptidase domain